MTAPSAIRVAAEYLGEAAVQDTNALVENIADFASGELEKAGFKVPADMTDQTIPYMQAITTAPWGGGPEEKSAQRVARKFLGAQVGTDTASIWAIAPEQLYMLVHDKEWRDALDGIWGDSPDRDTDKIGEHIKAMHKLVRQYGGAVFDTGADGGYNVVLETERKIPKEEGYTAPYATGEFDEWVKSRERVAMCYLRKKAEGGDWDRMAEHLTSAFSHLIGLFPFVAFNWTVLKEKTPDVQEHLMPTAKQARRVMDQILKAAAWIEETGADPGKATDYDLHYRGDVGESSPFVLRSLETAQGYLQLAASPLRLESRGG